MAGSRRQSMAQHFPTLSTPSPGLEGSIPISYHSQREMLNLPNICDTTNLSNDVAALGSTMNGANASPRSLTFGRNNIITQVEDYKRILDSVGHSNYATIKSLFDPNERHGIPPEIVPTVQVSFELFEAVQNRLAATRKTLDRTKGDLFTRNQQYTLLLSEMQTLKDEYATLQKRTVATESGNLSLHQQVAKQDVTLEQLNKEIGQVHLEMDMLIQKLKRRDEDLQSVRNRMAEGLVLLSQKDNVISALHRELEKYTQSITNFGDKDSALAMLNTDSNYSAEMLQSITDTVHGRTERARMKLSVADLEAKLRRLEEEKDSIVSQQDRYLMHVQNVISVQEQQLLEIEDALSAHVCPSAPDPLSLPCYPYSELGLVDAEGLAEISSFSALFERFPGVLEPLQDLSFDGSSQTMREGLEGCLEAQRGCLLVSQDLTRFLSTFERGVNGNFLSIYELREEWGRLQPSHFAQKTAQALQRCTSNLVKALLQMLEEKQRRWEPLEERKSTTSYSTRKSKDTGISSEAGGATSLRSGRANLTSARSMTKKSESQSNSSYHSAVPPHHDFNHIVQREDSRVSWQSTVDPDFSRPGSGGKEGWASVGAASVPMGVYMPTNCPNCHTSLAEYEVRGTEVNGARLGSAEAASEMATGVSKDDTNVSGASRNRLFHHSSEPKASVGDANEDSLPLVNESPKHDSIALNASATISAREITDRDGPTSCSENDKDIFSNPIPLRSSSGSILSNSVSVRKDNSRPHTSHTTTSAMHSNHSKGRYSVPTSRIGSLQVIRREQLSGDDQKKSELLAQQSSDTVGTISRDHQRVDTAKSISRASLNSLRTAQASLPLNSFRIPSAHSERPSSVRNSQHRYSLLSLDDAPRFFESEDGQHMLRLLSTVLNVDTSSKAFTRPLSSALRIRSISNADNSDRDIPTTTEVVPESKDNAASLVRERASSTISRTSRGHSNDVVVQLEDRMMAYAMEIDMLTRELEELRDFKARVEAAGPFDNSAILADAASEIESGGKRGTLSSEDFRGSEPPVSTTGSRYREMLSGRSHSSIIHLIPSSLHHAERSLPGTSTDYDAQRRQSTESLQSNRGIGLTIRKLSISVPDNATSRLSLGVSSRTSRTYSTDVTGENRSQRHRVRDSLVSAKFRETSAKQPVARNAKGVSSIIKDPPSTTKSTLPTTKGALPTTKSVPPTTKGTSPTTKSAPSTTKGALPITKNAPPTTKGTSPTTKSSTPTAKGAFPSTKGAPPNIQDIPPSPPPNKGATQRQRMPSINPGAAIQDSKTSRQYTARSTPPVAVSQRPTTSLPNNRTLRSSRGVAQAVQHRTSSGPHPLSMANNTRVYPNTTDKKSYYMSSDSLAQPGFQPTQRGVSPSSTPSHDPYGFSNVMVVGSRVRASDSSQMLPQAVEERGGRVPPTVPYVMPNFRGLPPSVRSNFHHPIPKVRSDELERLNKKNEPNLYTTRSFITGTEGTHMTTNDPEADTPVNIIIHSLSLSQSANSASSMMPGPISVRKEEPHPPAQQHQVPSPRHPPMDHHDGSVDALGRSISLLYTAPGQNLEDDKRIEGATIVSPRTKPAFRFASTHNYFAEIQNQIIENFLKVPEKLSSSHKFAPFPKRNLNPHLPSRRFMFKPRRALCRPKIHLATGFVNPTGNICPGQNIDSPFRRKNRGDSQDLMARGLSFRPLTDPGRDTQLEGPLRPGYALRGIAFFGRRDLPIGMHNRFESRGLVALLRRRIRWLREQQRETIKSKKLTPHGILSIVKPYCLLDPRQTTTSLYMLRRMLHSRRSRASVPLVAKRKDRNIRWGGGKVDNNMKK
ncbi:unnamed protein product [Phytomonas sp. Hart1]|nr:unnamed protein product [Phytomonas sp. Hart1]|eukprot:CCW69710.1 unnamed protein product [Phytomonas sp. isolate Hart1]